MNKVVFTFAGNELHALGTGTVFWPARRLLAVTDLHLGKSERMARRSGQMLPPYEVAETLTRLAAAIEATQPKTVICLGDSFDDIEAGRSLDPNHITWLNRLMAGREWIWIEGNHDPGPLDLGGTHLARITVANLSFRHIAAPTTAPGEISGHFHPKAQITLRGRILTRPCFLVDVSRLILPSFGTYTGGLRSSSEVLCNLMAPDAKAILTGATPIMVPMPRVAVKAGPPRGRPTRIRR